MKQLLTALFLMLSLTGVAEATTVVRTGETVSVGADQSVEGNFYALSGVVTISGTMLGDIHAVGGTVTINGPVSKDLFILGGTVSTHAAVSDDVRIIAGDITIANDVGGSLVVLGGRLNVLSTATIAGDILFYGGDAIIEGSVGGSVMGAAERVRIDGIVGQGVDITARYVTLGERADITGDVRYVSTEDATRAAGAVVTGNMTRSDVTKVETGTLPLRAAAMAFLVSLFATLSLYLILRRPLEKFALESTQAFGIKTLIGFATIFLAPITIVILLVSVLGFFVGLIGLFVLLLGLVLAIPLMNVVLGAIVSKLTIKRPEVNVLWITIGALLVQLALLVPFIGAVVLLLLLLGTLGTVILMTYRLVR